MRIVLLLVVTLGIGFTIYLLIDKTPEDYAVEAVDMFYAYEQDGAFSDSWAMFHPLMQEKFDKGHYLQDRAHVFMNHFGVTTFTYSLDEAVEVKNWKIEEGAEPIDLVYKVTVTQEYKGKYGRFRIVQDVYATMVEEEWKVLWDYNK